MKLVLVVVAGATTISTSVTKCVLDIVSEPTRVAQF